MKRGLILYSPLHILTAMWGLMFFLYYLNPFNLPEIRYFTWIILILGLSMIYLGFFTARLLDNRKLYNEPYTIRNDFPFSIVLLRKFVFITTTISLIGKIGTTYLVINELGSIEIFIIRPDIVRNFLIDISEGKASINMLQYKLFAYIGSLTTISIIVAGALSNIKKNGLLSIYPLFVAAFHSIFTLQRVYFIKHYVIWLACALIIIYYHPSTEQKEAFKRFIKKVLIFFLFSLFFILLVIFIRYLFSPTGDFQKIFNSFYFYSAGNIFLLDKYLITDQDSLYGLSLFRSFISWFSRVGLMEAGSVLGSHYEFYRIYNVMGNTFTYLRIPFEDFNIIGVIVVSYIWGAFGYFVLSRYLKHFSFFWLGLSAIILYSFFWSFYGFGLVHITTLIWKLFLLVLLDQYLGYRKDLSQTNCNYE